MAKPFSEIHNTDAKLSKQVRQSLKTTQGTRKTLTWRVVDIAVGAAVGVMSGVMFWVFDGLSYGLFPLLTLILMVQRRCFMLCSTSPPRWGL